MRRTLLIPWAARSERSIRQLASRWVALHPAGCRSCDRDEPADATHIIHRAVIFIAPPSVDPGWQTVQRLEDRRIGLRVYMLRVKPPRHAHAPSAERALASLPWWRPRLRPAHRVCIERDAPRRARARAACCAWAVKRGSWVGEPATLLGSPDQSHDIGAMIGAQSLHIGSCLLLRSCLRSAIEHACLSITGACDVCERGLDVRL